MSKKVGATALGLLPKGEAAKRSCDNFEKGESHHLCGTTSSYWFFVDYKGIKGYVPSACVEAVA
ncbi:hypothetical protein [Streptomyces lunalinharesii]|uniref:hypothetical protein n=1 Tax=Streptomyces lunalinharesii TaxID=333384 RepID=UPI0031D69930